MLHRDTVGHDAVHLVACSWPDADGWHENRPPRQLQAQMHLEFGGRTHEGHGSRFGRHLPRYGQTRYFRCHLPARKTYQIFTKMRTLTATCVGAGRSSRSPLSFYGSKASPSTTVVDIGGSASDSEEFGPSPCSGSEVSFCTVVVRVVRSASAPVEVGSTPRSGSVGNV